MTSYVLIHGTNSGAHNFHKVRPLLQQAGHEVFTPSLTGLGDRSHLGSPQIGLTTHIEDVVNIILYEDLHDVVLLGFAYGGFPITGAVDHIGDRLKAIVYEETVVPGNGDSYLGSGANPASADIRLSLGAPRFSVPGTRAPGSNADGEWAEIRRSPQSYNSMTEPLRLRTVLDEAPFERVFVKAGEPGRPEGGSPLWTAADRARDSAAWRYEELASPHSINSINPELLVKVLLDLA